VTSPDDTTARHSAPDPEKPSPRSVTLHGCRNSHTFFFAHETCPRCNAPTARTESPPDAILVSHTTVRVGPGRVPFGLGLARVASGAQTLCIIDGELGNDAEQEVVIEKRDALYYARPKRSP
jgi:uncharacterized OB-fold protein